MDIPIILSVYVAVGGFVVGLSDPDAEANDIWVVIALCFFWGVLAFVVAGQMVAQAFRDGRS